MGNSIQNLAEGVDLIASGNTWIEGASIQQLIHTSQLAGMQRVVGMPDLHPGRGYPVGAAFFSLGRFYPNLIGNDIGCGMSLWHTSLECKKHGAEKLEKRLGNIDGPLGDDWRDEIDALGLVRTGFEPSLGTIGGGNHFAEIQALDEIYDDRVSGQIGLDKQYLFVLVHSGSRGLGQQILTQHVERFGHKGLDDTTSDAASYLVQHEQALRFAQANRRLIALRMLDRLNAEGEPIIDLHHNYLSRANMGGLDGWLHRKGASPSDAGCVVIPGSRGDYSYLIEPSANELSLYSLAHGAGRKWLRGDCKARLSSRYSLEQLARTGLGGRVVCHDKQLMFEEAPEAYKSVDSIIESLSEAGLINVVARLKPVLTYKSRGEGCR